MEICDLVVKRIFVTGSASIGLPECKVGKAVKLLTILNSRNIELTSEVSADYLLAIDHNKSSLKEFIKRGGDPNKTILIRLEPPTVFPAQYKTSIANKYATIFTPGSILQNSNSFVGWPYQKQADPNFPTLITSLDESHIAFGEIDFKDWANREIALTMIAANKVAPSFAENYALRRNFAQNLDSLNFHLYGPLWNDSLRSKLRHRISVAYFALRQGVFPNIKSVYGDLLYKYPRSLGMVDDKHEILSKSKFSLVIENSNTYVSEKIFDSLLNGCIPVYFGPNLSDVNLPTEIAIRYEGPINLLCSYLQEISEEEIQGRLKAISLFLHSKNFKDFWLENSVYTRIADEIFPQV
jgi:hypothetical protein